MELARLTCPLVVLWPRCGFTLFYNILCMCMCKCMYVRMCSCVCVSICVCVRIVICLAASLIGYMMLYCGTTESIFTATLVVAACCMLLLLFLLLSCRLFVLFVRAARWYVVCALISYAYCVLCGVAGRGRPAGGAISMLHTICTLDAQPCIHM